MRIEGATALVTGTNGHGLGHTFVEGLLERGVRKVYATARRPELVDLPGAEVLPLDITDPESVAAAAHVADDVELLVNNAGVSLGVGLVDGDLRLIQQTYATHLFGTLSMIRAFAPVLAANGGGGIVNVLSNVAWTAFTGNSAYSAAKAAEWGLTNAVRLELAEQGTLVSGLVFGPTATETMLDFAEGAGTSLPDGFLSDPADIVRAALDGIEAGRIEVLADRFAIAAKATLSGDPQGYELT